MATETTNLGLTKPAGSDAALISTINDNMDIIDRDLVTILGAGDPTTATVGALGQHYRNTSSGQEFTCTVVDSETPEYTWESSASGFASSTHVHGNITNDGKIGSTADLVVVTTSDGLIITMSASDVRTLLGLGDAALATIGTSAGNLVALISGGKLPSSVIPSYSISEYKGTVSSKSDLATLSTAEAGDYAIVSGDATPSNDGTYILNGTYSTLSDWVNISTSGAVSSVNGQTGVVTLGYSDIGAASATQGSKADTAMQPATYDPTSVGGDAFDMDNMTQGTTNKYVSASELTVLQATSGTNTGDQDLSGKADIESIAALSSGGVISGGLVEAQDTPDQTVAVSACYIVTPEGKYYVVSANSALAADAADATNQRIDIVYITSAGVLAYLAGTAAASPVQPSTPSNGTLLAAVTRAANDNTIASSDIEDQRTIIENIESKQGKAAITENTNAAPALGTLANNTEYRCTHATPTAAPTMTIAAISSNTTEFACNVIYKAKASSPSAPAVTNNSGKTIKYQGDDVSSGTFTPVADTIYRLGWLWDGIYLNCYIKGV